MHTRRLPLLARRDVLRGLSAVVATRALAACGGRGGGAGSTSFFTPDERSALAVLADVILPPDDTPGGSQLGAVAYVEQLLTALDGDTPAIHAGGPFSGRTPLPDGHGDPSSSTPEDDFAAWLPLDRVALAAWRLRLYGGDGPNGPVVGWRDQLRQALAAAMQAAPGPMASLSPDDARAVYDSLDQGMRDLLFDLVTQAAFAAPEYGGNPGLAGWQLCHFEGDAAPLGYSLFDTTTGAYHERAGAPVSTANPGADPEPLDDEVRGLLATVTAFEGGKEFS